MRRVLCEMIKSCSPMCFVISDKLHIVMICYSAYPQDCKAALRAKLWIWRRELFVERDFLGDATNRISNYKSLYLICAQGETSARCDSVRAPVFQAFHMAGRISANLL